jgi:hypothetical protein
MRSAGLNAPAGALEVVPYAGVLGRVIKKVSRPLGEVIRKAFVEGIGETITEEVQTVIGNAVAAEGGLGYDKDRKVFQDLLRDPAAAGISAFLISALTGVATNGKPAASKPGQPATAPEPEAAPAPEPRTPVAEVTPELQANLERYSKQTGQEVIAVEPSSEEDAFDQEYVQHRGAKHVLVQSKDGKPLSHPGMFDRESGTVFTDASLPAGMHRRAVVLHEVLHVAEDAAPEAWSSLFEEVRESDPEGLAASEKWYDEHNPGESKDALRGESLSRYGETLVHWIQASAQHPEKFAEALTGSPTLRERLRDGLRALLAKVGVKIDSSALKRAQALVEELGLPASKDAEMNIRLARRFNETLDALVGTEYAPKKKPQPKSATQPGTPQLETAKGQIPDAQAASVPEAVDGAEPKLAEPGAAPALLDTPEVARVAEEDAERDPDVPERVAVGEIGVDPARFQFKSATTAKEGVRERDIGEVPYDHKLADIVLVWEDKSGAKWIVDGHHRLARAKRSGIDQVNAWVYREADGVTEAEARTKGAIKNIAGGHGDAVDAAKLIREMGWTEKELAAHKINTKSGLGRNAVGLSKLSPPVFALVVNGDLPANYGQIIGRELPEAGTQMEAAKAVAKLSSEDEVASAVAHMKTLPTTSSTQGGMFGEETLTRALVIERAKVDTAIRRRLKGERGLFKTLSRKAGTAKRVKGNKIDADASGAEAQELDSLLETVNQLSRSKGPIADVLNEAATRVSEGESVTKAASDAIERLAQLNWKEIVSGDAQAPPASRPASGLLSQKVDDAGAGGFRFAVSPTHVGTSGPSQSFTPAHTWRDSFKQYAQNYLIRPIRLGQALNLPADWTQTIESLPGATKHDLDQWRQRNLKPVKDALKTYEIEPWEAGRYAYALHAPDANALAMKRDAEEIAKHIKKHPGSKRAPKFGLQADPGSGMSNAEAAKIVAAVHADTKRAPGFKAIATVLQRVSREKLKLLVDSGLSTQEQVDAWREELGPHYVSLAGSEFDAPEKHVEGARGFGAKGKESKRREGRISRAGFAEIIPNTLSAHASKIVRAAHNEIGQEFGKWVDALKRPDIAERTTADYKAKVGEALFTFKEKGEEETIVIRDPAKDSDGKPLLARALEKLTVANGSDLIRGLYRAMGAYRNLRTTWNFEWFLSNLPSDLGDASITIQREGKGFARKVVKGIKPAIQAAWNAEHETGRASAWDKWYAEASENGALIGIADLPSPEDLRAELEGVIKSENPIKAVATWLERTSGSFEKGTRLSIYKAARDAGISEKDSARIARETTTPFIRKGEWSSTLGLMYAFFNARMQGAALVLNALRHGRVRGAVGVLMSTSFALAVANRFMMGEDDDGEDRWDKIRRDDRMNNIHLGIPGTAFSAKFRAPRSYRWAHVAATGMADMLFGDYKPEDYAKDMALALIDATSPLDTQASLQQAAVPSLAKPFAQVWANEDSFGGEVNPDYPNDKRPDSEQTHRNTPNAAKATARAINWLFGGDSVQEGAISIKPGTLDLVFKEIIGGAGASGVRLFETGDKLLRGEPTGANDYPLFRKIIASADLRHDVNAFNKSVRAVEKVTGDVSEYIERGDKDKAAKVREENPVEWRLRFRAKVANDRVTKLRKNLESLPAGSPLRAKREEQIAEVQSAYLKTVREWSKE